MSTGVRSALRAGVAARWSKPLGVFGAMASVAIGIYSDQVRGSIAWLFQHASGWGLAAATALGAGALSWQARGLMDHRRYAARRIVERSFDIEADDFESDLPSDQAVIGRELHYLERVTSSPHLVVLLHGLGLDADDFRPYMHVAEEHTAGITLFGFNARETRDDRYRPIGLTTHAELVNGAINNLHRQFPDKRLTLVGFSLGADMLLRLGELWRDHPSRKPAVSGVLLLDPNINHSTMMVSRGLSQLDPGSPLEELKRIARIPETLVEFQNLSEYLHKVSAKNLAQIQRHAMDVWDYWEPDGRYDLFMERIELLRGHRLGVKVVFSTHYERNFNDLNALARQRGIRDTFRLRRVDHFELLQDVLLAEEVGRVRGAATA
ncbi:alpha/beta fold hydrolase [Kitasatospora griseola]|uniref:alpha/beta fold hydrolase n=1 Tax=Kitasatospora griseola TaxID=2064 RepID=UPI003646C9C5